MLRILLRWLASTALVMALLFVVTIQPLAAAAQVEILPTANAAEFRFKVQGFRDSEEVSMWFTGPSQQVMAAGTKDTDDRGRADFVLRMPRHLQPGRWAITVHGLESNRETIGYFNLPLLGPDATLQVSPASGSSGTTFAFGSADFTERETISYWLTGPDGAVYPGGLALASRNGRVDFTYTIGAGTQPGQWAMSAYGWQSNHYAVARFTVE